MSSNLLIAFSGCRAFFQIHPPDNRVAAKFLSDCQNGLLRLFLPGQFLILLPQIRRRLRKQIELLVALSIARAGFFSSDRTIAEYNEKIWHLEPLDL